MSCFKRLITFPGQGSVVDIQSIKFTSKKIQSYIVSSDFRDYWDYLLKNPNKPGTIVMLSRLLYQDAISSNFINTADKTLLLGHSLGELSCLTCGGNENLLKLSDVFEIANFRNELMRKESQIFYNTINPHALKNTGNVFEMRAMLITSSFLKKNNITDFLQTILLNEIKNYNNKSDNTAAICVANINSPQQLVLSGVSEDIENFYSHNVSMLPRKYKILNNPDDIPFHNSKILARIQPPLYDFIWNKLRENGTSSINYLNVPIVNNINGEITYTKDEALENFVKGSTNTVDFVKCCETIKKNISRDNSNENISDSLDIINIGPTQIINNLLLKNNLK
ncbi:uncharacterized protein SCODWIG_01105 [Saccharomycodes ludwigii]|uniref:[acyl-carrier-protein] S-malonyltransferase n=1 Tax=Saccharomycodes ludwigii TaxID=36035 RepID=A0A376B4F7_9ASCO|nr:hypothetical protein SCDLUD_002091 [Saccharomycodes ludwigii]KAH3902273.1 hypothetical protein SCDLUD_002091 [Saccharomycodes ludwigii]SSD59344.1 uncharacterized protein SCODWIG_01105 [Saccharomycodes ludwigii]